MDSIAGREGEMTCTEMKSEVYDAVQLRIAIPNAPSVVVNLGGVRRLCMADPVGGPQGAADARRRATRGPELGDGCE